MTDILTSFKRTTEEIFTLDAFKEQLKLKRPLRIKYGVDVTAPFLHIGHGVNLWMMRELQDLGHKVIFLIGDFTTRIGDPTGKSETRPTIPEEEIEKNAQEFIRQVSLILKTDPELFEIRRNSEWFNKISLSQFISLLSMITHARLISRDMFQDRISARREIYIHEMLYPILQGYDSVMIKSDLTLVGTDQLFNEMMGRFFQERYAQVPQVIITTKITPGTDGKEKQSKSMGNYIGLEDTPADKFGKIMSIPDNLILSYFEVYTSIPSEELVEIKRRLDDQNTNPRDIKLYLAEKIVERYHERETAGQERDRFIKIFSKREIPEDIPEVIMQQDKMDLLHLVKTLLPNTSNSECRRLIIQGAVEINNNRSREFRETIRLKTEDIIRIGKRRWWRLKILR